VATDARPKWRPSPVGLAALLLGEDLGKVMRLPGADRIGHLEHLLDRAFGAANAEAVFYPGPGDYSLIDALLDAKMQGDFPDATTAYHQLESQLDEQWKAEAKRLWSDCRPGFEALLATQLSVKGSVFETPDKPRSVGRYALAEQPLVTNGALLLEPVQGPWPDCWLVASMAAVAWSELETFNDLLRACVPHDGPVSEVRWRFRHQVRERAIENSFPRARNKARIHSVSGSADETWPALIEKAFASREKRAEDDPGDGKNPTLAQYRALSLRWPSEALSLLGPKDYKEEGIHLVDYLRACCPINKVPAVPVVASTLESLDHRLDGYRIVANHAYAVLGLDESHGDTYVVLREPYGHLHKNQRIDFDSVEFEGRPVVGVGVDGVIALPEQAFRLRFRNVSVPVGTVAVAKPRRPQPP
jgi:hypothetical protein